MSTVPILCERLGEIGFRETIKRLKKQKLLVKFVKDLVAKWSAGFPEVTQYFGLEKSLTGDYHQSNSPEEKPHEPTSQENQEAGIEDYFGLSSCSPDKISHLNPSQTSHIRSSPWESSSRSRDHGAKRSHEQQLAGQNVVQVSPPFKRKRQLLCQAEVQTLPAKVPSCECPSPKDLSLITACSIQESHSNGQDCFPRDVVLESSSPEQEQEAPAWGWALRKNHKTQVYSGRRPADCLQQKANLWLLDEDPSGTWDIVHCQACKDIAGPVQPEEISWPENETCKQTNSHPESHTGLQLPESQEERLKRLRAHIKSQSTKRQQARQTIMVSFYNQHKSPGQQGEPGRRGVASTQHTHSLPEAPTHPRAQRGSCLNSGERSSKKAQAKRPAPLMAKALRAYSYRLSKK
ncbi:elongin-A3 member D-like [Grammomys surdaster]|uniref:elongin-A3 member D-like n=1 Tax=Grammomys surdaster TaxID=491861 RepID=UPI00109F113E|nr:elongin-A3 member D-like [Grammomys surdaster]